MRQRLTVILVCVVLASCAHAGRKSAPLALGLPDSGKDVPLVVGQVVTVRLAWNPSTGYRWQTTSDPDARVMIVVDTGYDPPPQRMPGSGGQAWWKLRATGAGTTSFALRYVRPWQVDEKAQEFTLNVHVNEK